MADNILFTNDASALLAASINDTDLVITLETGFGALFPSPSGSQYFRAALQDADGNLEIVHATARSGDNVTVVRGQEGTAALSWTLGITRFELRLTAETMEEMLQKNGGTMTGDLDMDENNLVDPNINGPNARMTEGQIIGVPLRGAADDSSNEVAVPDDGTRATAGGAAIRTAADNGLSYLPVGTILMWYAALGGLPSGWQECNGTNGTPDLREKFPRGVGGSITLGLAGGSATASGSTGASGAHTHTGSAAAHALTQAELPPHRHRLQAATIGGATNAVSLGGNGRTIAGWNVPGGDGFRDTSAHGLQLVEDTGSGAAHSHGVSLDPSADHTHTLATVSTIPPFVGVYFIMRVS